MPTDRPSSDHASSGGRSHAEIVGELEELLVHGGAGVVATDLDGAITHWTAGAERLYGWSAAEVVGRDVVELLVAPEDRPLAEANMETIRTTGAWEGGFAVRTKDGGIMPAYFRGTLIKDDNGQPVGLLSLSMDISEERESPA